MTGATGFRLRTNQSWRPNQSDRGIATIAGVLFKEFVDLIAKLYFRLRDGADIHDWSLERLAMT